MPEKRENGKSPRVGNTGALNTSNNYLNSLVDWVSFTLFNVKNLKEVIDLLGLNSNDFIFDLAGNYGYKFSARFGHISIYYFGREDMGYHVEMSGQGCREYEIFYNDWKYLIENVIEKGGKFSRIDLAVDDTKPYFLIKNVVKKIKKGEIKSKFKTARKIEEILLETGNSKGITVYFGRPSSRIQIRMYEKKLERQSKGYDVPVNVWNRIEIQTRDDLANNLAMLLLNNNDDLGIMIKSILKNYINFLDRSKDTNKSRWKISKFWLDFLSDVEKLKITSKKPERTIHSIESWIDRQVKKSLSMLFYANGLDIIVEKINDGLKSLTDKDLQLIEIYKKRELINSQNDKIYIN